MSKTELVIANQKARVEASMKLGLLSLEHGERLLKINTRVAKAFLEQGNFNLQAIEEVKGTNSLFALQKEAAEVAVQEAASYARHVLQIVTDAEADLSALAEVSWNMERTVITAWMGLEAHDARH